MSLELPGQQVQTHFIWEPALVLWTPYDEEGYEVGLCASLGLKRVN